MELTERPGEGPGGVSMWDAACVYDPDGMGGGHWHIVDQMQRPTLRADGGAALLVAEVERLRAEHAASQQEVDSIYEAGGETLLAWGNGNIREGIRQMMLSSENHEATVDRWAVYDPIEESYDFHGTERSALVALDGIVDALRDRSSREVEGWDDNAEEAAVYALHRIAGLEFRTVATAGDGTDEGKECERHGWSHMAEAEIVRVGSDGDGEK